jgi:hypothetical protein
MHVFLFYFGELPYYEQSPSYAPRAARSGLKASVSRAAIRVGSTWHCASAQARKRASAQARKRASAQARKRASAQARKRASAQARKRANLLILNFFFEFSIFRPIFRPIFRTKFTHIFNTPPTCLVTPHLWSNHLALAQLTHKWPRNYQKTVFPADISDF